ncbi:hypothetical protein QL992_06150 [Microbacterium sp. APC 3898]|uniref:DUF1572 domain-containing protein n=1 Tax=Planococcus notacanthi TaxID=3035188 RepID=A0ABT7ZMW1_9BACL|nr:MULTISPECIES: DUF1572 domain-containing protein [Terrabacteria group]MDN3428510.1 DUF1572 domain-containing protein [Planococcus sp. APC 4016]MDN3498783.1 hypothetical protein [Microbacterium sp. APC 3898]
MENIFLLTAVLATLLVMFVVVIYFRRKNRTIPDAEQTLPQESSAPNDNEKPDVEEDANEPFLPQVTEVQNKETVKTNYKKIEIPSVLKMDIQQTLAAGSMIIEDYKTYKVEFSPEVVKGLKDKSMTLIEKANGKGYLPAVNKEGVKGIYKQGVLVRKINPGLVVHASYGLLTAVVGQQQLVEIQSSLKSMERKLAVLVQNRENDFAGKIESKFGYFKEVIERYRRNGITLGGVEDHQIEGFYADTLQDLKVLMKDLKAIGARIEGLKEYENIRKWGEAPVKKDYENLIEQFEKKQELVRLNVRFIEECYEPYLSTIRNYEEVNVKSQTLADLIVENNSIISTIEDKVRSIEENYKVKINLGIKALKYRDLESLKELVPARISQQKSTAQEIPSEILVEMADEGKVYAYVPK